MIRYPKILLGSMLVLPFLSLPLIGKKSFKRFMPAGIFIISIMAVVDFIAKKRRWWLIYEKIHPKVPGIIPFLSPFFIGSIWIMKWTYGKFLRFTLVNLLVDCLFIYVFVKFLTRSGIASIFGLKEKQVSLIFFIQSLMLYGFQYVKEKVTKRRFKF
ncbi:hypothetical protein [Bacillus sp. SG-1]|uniref:hypothetical protein n=1 Tax=Bacillus sp. SG-1 TaxID=161544 RepID=UPI0005C798E7|nr:hypothetical protein [Bacillus sp. SG-1]